MDCSFFMLLRSITNLSNLTQSHLVSGIASAAIEEVSHSTKLVSNTQGLSECNYLKEQDS